MAYGVIMLYHLHMPSYILRRFTEYSSKANLLQKPVWTESCIGNKTCSQRRDAKKEVLTLSTTLNTN